MFLLEVAKDEEGGREGGEAEGVAGEVDVGEGGGVGGGHRLTLLQDPAGGVGTQGRIEENNMKRGKGCTKWYSLGGGR